MPVRILDPKLPLSDPRMSRMAAEAIVLYGFNASRAARELRPDLSEGAQRNFAVKLLASRHVQRELERLMTSPENNATEFVAMMWRWARKLDALVNSETPIAVDKSTVEAGLTGARVLARGYINEKSPEKPAGAPMVLDIGRDGVAALTGEKPKVM